MVYWLCIDERYCFVFKSEKNNDNYDMNKNKIISYNFVLVMFVIFISYVALIIK